MKIFVDTAKLDEIKEACSWGIVDGVTTNPSLIKRAVDALKEKGEKVDMLTYIEQILKTAGEGHPVSLEVISLTSDEMFKEAIFLYERFNKVAGNVVIKIPINTFVQGCSYTNFEGLKTIKKLSERDIPVNCTLIMTPEQALLAAKAGARYASPFAGRVDDYIRKNLGISFKKGDYFDFELIEELRYQALEESIEDYIDQGERVDELYQNEEIIRGANFGKDNGISSGVDLVVQIVQIYSNYGFGTEVIASSMRNARQVREVAQAGAHIATIPFSVIKEMMQHPKTEEGIKLFTRDVVPEYRKIFEEK
ncbi:transaldolase [Candidatus Aerophobetes bacterium]|uniref:Transaldolase n=1 Tax=Aerophobetes bacterium TaxID=2030807 RepID=A0A662D8X5_UNCAE|nr:MAG: transaldolase [Candidatus Aerophobetes bacterium]